MVVSSAVCVMILLRNFDYITLCKKGQKSKKALYYRPIPMDEKAKIKSLNNWMKFLNTEEVKFHLTCASLYLTAYEMLIDTMLRLSKDFYTVGYDGTNDVISEDYTKSLKQLYPKDIVIASAMWFQSKLDCLNEKDVELIKELKAYRNQLAHEMPKVISEIDYDVKTHYIEKIRDLYKKIHLWWFIEIESTTDPDTDENSLGVDPELAISFIMLPMEYFLKIITEETQKRTERIEKEANEMQNKG